MYLWWNLLFEIQYLSFCVNLFISFAVDFQVSGTLDVQNILSFGGFYINIFQCDTVCLTDNNPVGSFRHYHVLHCYVADSISGSPLKNIARPEPLQIILEIWISRKAGVSSVTGGIAVFIRLSRSSSDSSPAPLPP